MITNNGQITDKPAISRQLDERVLALMSILPGAIDTVMTRRAKLITEIEQLKLEGVTNATPYYKGGVYLVLVHPTDVCGHRKREYIGADPDKIRIALARVERFQRYQSLKNELATLNSRMQQAEESLVNVFRALRIEVPFWARL